MSVARCCAALLAIAPLAAGHGWLMEPPARNAVSSSKNGNCPHCGNGGSSSAPGSVCGDGNQWPAGSNYVGFVQAPQRTYTAGSVVQFDISMNVNHRGHHEFHICDRPISSDSGAVECLQRWPVMRVPPEEVYSDCQVNDPRDDCQPIDPNYPGRWYHPAGKRRHTIRYRIPEGLQCEHCTLQWFWPTSNSGPYDRASYSCYNKLLTSLGWNIDFCGWACSDQNCPVPYAPTAGMPRSPDPSAGSGFEEFRNCADIRVLAAGGSTPAPATAAPTPMPAATVAPMPAPMAPTPAPAALTPAPTTSEPEPEPEPAPATGSADPRCQGCTGHSPCIWSDGMCYPAVARDACLSSSEHVWCGSPEQSLTQKRQFLRKAKSHATLGASLIQDEALLRKTELELPEEVENEEL